MRSRRSSFQNLAVGEWRRKECAGTKRSRRVSGGAASEGLMGFSIPEQYIDMMSQGRAKWPGLPLSIENHDQRLPSS